MSRTRVAMVVGCLVAATVFGVGLYYAGASSGRANPPSSPAPAPSSESPVPGTTTEEPSTVTVTTGVTPTEVVTSTAEPTTTVAPPPPPTTEAPPPSPDVRSDSQIRADASSAYTVANTYWSNLFDTWHDNSGGPVAWWRPYPYRGNGFYDSARSEDFYCGTDPLGPKNASFCGTVASGTGTVAWDMELFREKEAEFGNPVVYVTVAHEVGHAAQVRFRHDGEGLATPPSNTPEYEQQADCLGGATLAKAEQDGYVIVDQDVLPQIAGFMWSLEGGGEHGSNDARLSAFKVGYNTGNVESCLYNQGVPPPGLLI